MKFARLTKEQFEELQKEFITFLSTQSITAAEWENLKLNKPEVAEMELDVFSDLVWEGILNKAKYLEHISSNFMYLFHLGDDQIHVIVIQVKDKTIDITTPEGYHWLRNNLMEDGVDLFKSDKKYSDDKNIDKFNLMKQGASITKGELYQYFYNLIH